MAAKTHQQTDRRIDTLQSEAAKLRSKLEKIIDEMKARGPHSINGDNALMNTREWLRNLSQR